MAKEIVPTITKQDILEYMELTGWKSVGERHSLPNGTVIIAWINDVCVELYPFNNITYRVSFEEFFKMIKRQVDFYRSAQLRIGSRL